MHINEVDIQVRFNEVDEMGIVHNSVYYIWFEIARYNFALKALNIRYQDLKNLGLLVPVVHSECQFKRPAFYPDDLRITCFLEPTEKALLILHYKIIRIQDNQLIAKGKTINAFTDLQGNLKLVLPDIVKNAMNNAELNPEFILKK